jgi:transcriptional regulator with GAF, ATPase, and Fis domain
MTPADVTEPDFIDSLALIRKALNSKKPEKKRFNTKDFSWDNDPVKEALCLPLKKGHHLWGLFYLDNIFLDNQFSMLDDSLIKWLARFMGVHIEQIVDYNRLKEDRKILSSVKSSQMEQVHKEEIVYESQVMARLLAQSDQLATTESTILIQGETGVGKELLARRIHNLSSRSSGPLEIIELTSIPENLLESELFGYEKGAFTGADRQKQGRIESAHAGTLFLDEIGEIPLSFQAKLLRVLQEKTFNRLGGTKTLTSDFRLIVATNKNLQDLVDAGQFRQDLFYRLNIIPITIPPLREREQDMLLLADYFLTQYRQKYGKEQICLAPEHMVLLQRYPWPGNVRELKNVIERAVLLSKDGELDLTILQTGGLQEKTSILSPSTVDHTAPMHLLKDLPTLEEFEKRYLMYVIEETQGRIGGQGGAADLLGVKRTSLYTRMKKLGISNNSCQPAKKGERKKR